MLPIHRPALYHSGRAVFLGLIVFIGPHALCSATDAAHAAVPIHLAITLVKSNPVTTIAVGGRTVQAIVDTGGGALILSKEVLEGAGAVTFGETSGGNDAYGHEIKAPRYQVPVVTIGGLTFRNMTALQAQIPTSGEGPAVQNSIGRQFLSQYLAVIDYAHLTISLWPPDAKTAASANCGSTRIPMERAEDDELVVGEFGSPSGRLALLLDTGATYSMLKQKTADKLQLQTTVRGPSSPKFYLSNKLSAAGHDLGPVEFVILPLEQPRDVDGMLGANWFANHVVCISYKLREIRIR